MANEIAVPEHLRKFLSNSGASSDADSMASASISVPRISLKGRKFRFKEGGEELKRPQDEIYVVILAVEPGAGLNQKTYYEKGYQQGDSSPPDCSSSDGVRPDPWVQQPVHPTCRGCPKNAFGTATQGKGKACKDSKRLWVVEPDSIDGTVFALGVPVTSLKEMAAYGAMLKANGIPVSAVVTKISMKDSEFPELLFEYVGVLEQEPMEKAMLRNEQKDWNMPRGPMLEGPTSSEPMAAPGKPVGGDKLLENKSKGDKQLSADEAVENW